MGKPRKGGDLLVIMNSDVKAQESRCLFSSGRKVFFGDRKEDGSAIYLSAPSWDCGWYWSFGYLGNSREHYHLSSFANGRNINMFDALKADYHLCKSLQEDRMLWLFCELAQTAYSLKETAAVLRRGGSHYTDNPCKEIVKNQVEVERLNREVLPAIFAEISKLFQ